LQEEGEEEAQETAVEETKKAVVEETQVVAAGQRQGREEQDESMDLQATEQSGREELAGDVNKETAMAEGQNDGAEHTLESTASPKTAKPAEEEAEEKDPLVDEEEEEEDDAETPPAKLTWPRVKKGEELPENPLGKDEGVTPAEIEARMIKEFENDTFVAVNRSRKLPIEKFSRLRIPLCRMVSMPEVRPVLESEVLRLQSEFRSGYRVGSAVFYVALTDAKGREQLVTDDIIRKWSSAWDQLDNEFDIELNSDPDLKPLRGKMFFIYDGNHRYTAWKRYIDEAKMENMDWHRLHGMPDCLVLEIHKNLYPSILRAMHSVNK
jgi:hypothetical protein